MNNSKEFEVFDNITNKIDENYFKNFIRVFNNNIKTFLLFVFIIFILSYYFLSIEIALILIIFLLLVFYFIIKLPEIKKRNLYTNISREIPFALRQMAIELKSGKGLNDVLLSISKSDYGILSIEFSRVINEVKYGMYIEDSLINMSKRVNSKSLNRLIYQIITSKKLGSNLSNALSIIAEDTSFNMRIKLKNYSQKLNAFIMIYTFIVILIPVVFLIILIGASTVIGDVINPDVLIILYLFFFPMIILFMGVLIKKLEPKI
ncbi:MAG: type II secretion system F family protein [Methanobrevibacter wolinii]